MTTTPNTTDDVYADIIDDGTAPAGGDTAIAIDDIDVHRTVEPRASDEPIVAQHAGPVIDVITGPRQNTWSVCEVVLADRHGIIRVGGTAHDAVDVTRGHIRPVEIKSTIPAHDGRHRDGCFILRRTPQHAVLRDVADSIQDIHGFAPSGDYLFALYERLDELVILLDETRLSAADVDRLVDIAWYEREDRPQEASVEWHDIPGIEHGEMLRRLNVAPTYIRALGGDPDDYRDEISRVRAAIHDVT